MLIADKGYDAASIVQAAHKKGAQVVIPCRTTRKCARPYDKTLYKQRNLIERMFNKLKHFRRVATRYDKLAERFLAWVTIAGILLWLK